jgi:hemolysin activation/secretion protein
MRVDGGINFGPVNDFTGSLNFLGQYSGKPLLTYEQEAIGNFTIGRGYDPASLNGDRAAAASAEIHWAPMPASWLVTAAPYLFYDTARVWNLTAGSQQREARSLGGGFVFRVTSHFQFDTFYAHPMDRISTVTSRRPPDRVFLNATIAY